MTKTIVISAIGLQSGGTLSILQDCIKELSGAAYREHRIYIVLKNRALAGGDYPTLNFIELDGTRSYLHRWYYEYFYFKKLSRELKVDLWFSLHDLTPSVEAKRRVVYCHNPSPFYTITFRELLIDPKFALFTWVYWILYKINIKKNDFVVVQQSWLRKEFTKMFEIDQKKIVVAHPNVFFNSSVTVPLASDKKVFFYPTLPRVFKNIEVIGDAIELLQSQGEQNFDVIFTIDGTENRYAKKLRAEFGHLPNIQWLGQIPREKVYQIYATASCLIFPSKLETWGLPISEFKNTGKPILLAEMPYAHETAGDYDALIFFKPDDSEALASHMQRIIKNEKHIFQENKMPEIEAPVAQSWAALFDVMLSF